MGLRDIFECELCPAGYFCPEGATAPEEHLEGYYNPWMGISKGEMFLKCPPGYACTTKGMFSYLYASPCQAGYYCPGGSKVTNAYPCPPGTYGEREFLGLVEECKTCPAGSYCANKNAAVEIIAPYAPCAEGVCTGTSFADIIHASSNKCPIGYYCPPGTRMSKEVYIYIYIYIVVPMSCWYLPTHNRSRIFLHRMPSRIRLSRNHSWSNGHNRLFSSFNHLFMSSWLLLYSWVFCAHCMPSRDS